MKKFAKLHDAKVKDIKAAQQKDINAANDALGCAACCAITHGQFMQALVAAVEAGREHPEVPSEVVALYTSEASEEDGSLIHMVGAITVQQAPTFPVAAVVPASYSGGDERVN